MDKIVHILKPKITGRNWNPRSVKNHPRRKEIEAENKRKKQEAFDAMSPEDQAKELKRREESAARIAAAGDK